MERLYLDLHVIQTVPPSCINRDDTGSPKTAQFGGAKRSRVSSQSWKRAMRDYFIEQLPQDKLGIRSKKIMQYVAEEIEKINDEIDAYAAAEQIFNHVKISFDKEKETGALFFLSRSQAKALAELAVSRPDLLKNSIKKTELSEIQTALQSKPSIDLAFFGRMVAENAALNVDASAQVAHAISTHAVVDEYDYFTALDDLREKDQQGAAHLDTVEFNSATLYRYANLAVHDLIDYLEEDTYFGIETFINAFVKSMPTGKQNTFANRTLPDALILCIRKDQPINLVGAFEKPVPISDNGFVKKSVTMLVDHAKELYEDFAGEPYVTYVVGKGMEQLSKRESLQNAISLCIESLKECF